MTCVAFLSFTVLGSVRCSVGFLPWYIYLFLC
jgi:hypothetical protein